MRLIEDGRAPNPRRVRLFLAEKGIEIETVQVDINADEHKTPEFTKLNRSQRIPVLELDDGTIITETVAICRYFEEIQPSPPLFGQTPVEKALVEMWQRRLELELFYTIAQAFRHSHPMMAAMENPQVPDWSKVNLDRIPALLDRFDEELEGRDFFAGDQFTIADITAVVAIDFMRVLRIRLDDQHPNLTSWHARMAARPSYHA